MLGGEEKTPHMDEAEVQCGRKDDYGAAGTELHGVMGVQMYTQIFLQKKPI